jgi:hypothetical protein
MSYICNYDTYVHTRFNAYQIFKSWIDSNMHTLHLISVPSTIYIWDHPFKTSANFHDFLPLPPHVRSFLLKFRHSEKAKKNLAWLFFHLLFDPFKECQKKSGRWTKIFVAFSEYQNIYYPSAHLTNFWPLPPKKCRYLKWMVPIWGKCTSYSCGFLSLIWTLM